MLHNLKLRSYTEKEILNRPEGTKVFALDTGSHGEDDTLLGASYEEALTDILSHHELEELPEEWTLEELEGVKMKIREKRVFQTVEISGRKFAILLDDEYKRAFEAVWTEDGWETDFSYPAIGIDSFDVAGELDFDAVKEMGYTFVE